MIDQATPPTHIGWRGLVDDGETPLDDVFPRETGRTLRDGAEHADSPGPDTPAEEVAA